MKRFICAFLFIFVVTSLTFSQVPGDDYDDGYVYEQNGQGDQFIKINLGLLFPLNFKGQLHNGGMIELGYYRFLNKWLCLGGEINASYNISIGNKILVTLPLYFGVGFQPSYNKFEFPIFINMGIAYETFANMDYFPSFAFKTTAGAFYRINEICSCGVNLMYQCLPQTSSNKEERFAGNFFAISIGARYHF